MVLKRFAFFWPSSLERDRLKKLAFFPFGSEEEMASKLLRSAKPPFPPEVGKASC